MSIPARSAKRRRRPEMNTPELRRVLKKVLAQCTVYFAISKNWSPFGGANAHGKKKTTHTTRQE